MIVFDSNIRRLFSFPLNIAFNSNVIFDISCKFAIIILRVFISNITFRINTMKKIVEKNQPIAHNAEALRIRLISVQFAINK